MYKLRLHYIYTSQGDKITSDALYTYRPSYLGMCSHSETRYMYSICELRITSTSLGCKLQDDSYGFIMYA